MKLFSTAFSLPLDHHALDQHKYTIVFGVDPPVKFPHPSSVPVVEIKDLQVKGTHGDKKKTEIISLRPLLKKDNNWTCRFSPDGRIETVLRMGNYTHTYLIHLQFYIMHQGLYLCRMGYNSHIWCLYLRLLYSDISDWYWLLDALFSTNWPIRGTAIGLERIYQSEERHCICGFVVGHSLFNELTNP